MKFSTIKRKKKIKSWLGMINCLTSVLIITKTTRTIAWLSSPWADQRELARKWEEWQVEWHVFHAVCLYFAIWIVSSVWVVCCMCMHELMRTRHNFSTFTKLGSLIYIEQVNCRCNGWKRTHHDNQMRAVHCYRGYEFDTANKHLAVVVMVQYASWYCCRDAKN